MRQEEELISVIPFGCNKEPVIYCGKKLEKVFNDATKGYCEALSEEAKAECEKLDRMMLYGDYDPFKEVEKPKDDWDCKEEPKTDVDFEQIHPKLNYEEMCKTSNYYIPPKTQFLVYKWEDRIKF